MSLLQGDPLPNIDTTKTVETSGPDWYNKYLEELSKAGTTAMQTKEPGKDLVAGFQPLQTGVLDTADASIPGYETELQKAQVTAETAAKGITPSTIASFMNPYTSGYTDPTTGVHTAGVVDEMERLQQQNLQRNLLPSMKGAFAGTGALGSQRMMGAMGQMGADIQSNLLGQQTKALETGYEGALKAAGDQAGLLRQAAETQRGLATTEEDAMIKQLQAIFGYGTEQQKQKQAEIQAPLTAAQSAANIFSNIKTPSTVAETANAPIPGAYASSPLSQIAGLGSLFASGSTGGTSAASGVGSSLTDAYNWLQSKFSNAGNAGNSSLSNLSSNGHFEGGEWVLD